MPEGDTMVGTRVNLLVTSYTEWDLFSVDSSQILVKGAEFHIKGFYVFDVVHLNSYVGAAVSTGLLEGADSRYLSVSSQQWVTVREFSA